MKPLKILHLITTLGAGGAENHLFLLAREQKRKGHSVRVAYFRASGNLTDSFEKEGIPVSYLKGQGYLSLTAFYRSWKLIRNFRPDVLHTHLFSGDFYGALVGTWLGVPVLISSKHNQDQYLKKRLFKQLGRFLIRLDHQVIAISEAVKTFTIEAVHYPPSQAENKFTRIYYGIDLEELDQTPLKPFSKESWSIPKDALLLGTIGRLSEQKGYPYLISAVARLRQEFPNLHCIAVGRGEQEAEIRNKIKEQNLEKYFHLLGYHNDRSTLLGILNAMDIFVLPSLWEGFGLVLAEAMALRKPIVASTAGSIPEVVSPECGYLVPPKEKDALVTSLRELLLHPEKRTRMGRSGRKRVEELFSLQPMVEQTEQLYRKFLPP